jgi:hypothetical protein
VSVDIWSTSAVPGRPNSELAPVTCVRRAALQRRPLDRPSVEIDTGPALWFVTVTLGGDSLDPEAVRAALEQLAQERAFVVSAHYGERRAEVRYWDECDDVDLAVRQALSLWGDDEVSARLPGWTVIGLEAVDRATARRQSGRGDHPRVLALGEILPFD